MFTIRSKKASSREPDTLPRGWQEMSVDALWNALNDPRRFSTPLCMPCKRAVSAH
jgi:hypothetical protein